MTTSRTALDTLMNICNTNLVKYDFRYCLVDSNKHPFKIDGTFARPNESSDFVAIDNLINLDPTTLSKYDGIGVSVQASKISAIDVDHCFSESFNIDTADLRAKDIIDSFKDFAYIEFSFSGTGLRLFFKSLDIDDYELLYYTKNSKQNIEFYYCDGSARYVTMTGKAIVDNPVKDLDNKGQAALQSFLDRYMKRSHALSEVNENDFTDDRSIEELMKIVKKDYLTDFSFQNLWFEKAPGSGSNESERDYHLVAYLYDFVTKDKSKIKELFERSPFYKSKDWKHMNKWQKQDFRYFNYLYSKIQGGKQ